MVRELSNSVDIADSRPLTSHLASIKRSLPPTEKIESGGHIIAIDNQWLAAALEQFESEPEPVKRNAILTSIGERLLSISESVDELRRPADGSPAQTADKQKLAEILSRGEFQKLQARQESVFQKWLRQFLEWLDSLFPAAPSLPGASADIGSLRLVLQIAILGLVVIIVAYLFYKFVPFRGAGRRVKKGKTDRVILGEHVGSDQTAADIFRQAEELAREGDLRGAIRKGYIALLCELNDRKLIGLSRYKTNRDYLMDLKPNKRLFENMHLATGSYERNWYGLHDADVADWDEFRRQYSRTVEASS